MFDRARVILALSSCLLGLGHLGLAAATLKVWSLDALWFAGAALAIASAGLANLPAESARARLLQSAAMAAYFAAAWPLLPSAQVAIGFILFAALTTIALHDVVRQRRAAA